jgi:hypothetical protein
MLKIKTKKNFKKYNSEKKNSESTWGNLMNQQPTIRYRD